MNTEHQIEIDSLGFTKQQRTTKPPVILFPSGILEQDRAVASKFFVTTTSRVLLKKGDLVIVRWAPMSGYKTKWFEELENDLQLLGCSLLNGNKEQLYYSNRLPKAGESYGLYAKGIMFGGNADTYKSHEHKEEVKNTNQVFGLIENGDVFDPFRITSLREEEYRKLKWILWDRLVTN